MSDPLARAYAAVNDYRHRCAIACIMECEPEGERHTERCDARMEFLRTNLALVKEAREHEPPGSSPFGDLPPKKETP